MPDAQARQRRSGACVIDIFEIFTGLAGEEADARARIPLPDGPMWSLATLGVPLLQIGDAADGIPLSRLTDVVWRDASAIAPGEQDSVGGASRRAWSDLGSTDHATTQARPSLDLRSRDLVVPTSLGEVAYVPDDAQTAVAGDAAQRLESGSWGDSVPRIVVTPWQYDPRTTPDDRGETFSDRSDYQAYPSAAANVDPAFADDRFDQREQKDSAPYGDVGLELSISDADPDYVWAGAKYAARAIRPGGRPSTQPALRPLHREPAPILTSAQLDRLDFFSLQQHLGRLVPKHPQLQNLSGPDWRPTSRDRESMRAHVEHAQRHMVAVRQNQQYQHLGDRPQNHHVHPKYLGGAKQGQTVPLRRDYHQVITNEFRKLHAYGKSRPPLAKALEFMEKVYSRFPLPW